MASSLSQTIHQICFSCHLRQAIPLVLPVLNVSWSVEYALSSCSGVVYVAMLIHVTCVADRRMI